MSVNTTRKARGASVVRLLGITGLGLAAVALAGCPFAGLPNTTALAAVEPVSVADGVTVDTPLGAGAASLANSTWAVYKADDDSLLFRIKLGPNGELTRMFDSFVFASEWLGSEIIPDGRPHPAELPGATYVSGAYAAEQNDSVGVLGVLHGMLLGAHLGSATLSFFGPIEGDRIDGSMVRTVTVLAETPFPAPGDAQFGAYALREQE